MSWWLVSLEIKMGGKKKIDPATGKRMKYPSDFKKKKLRTTEQKAERRQKETDVGRFRPTHHSKVHFTYVHYVPYVRQCVQYACTDDVFCREPRCVKLPLWPRATPGWPR